MTTRINANSSGLNESVDTSGVLEFQTANTSALIIDANQNANFAGSGAVTVPVGTTAQRPSGVNGMIRYNSNVSIFEVYANNVWSAANVTPSPVNTVAPVISGSAVVGQNLTSTTGTWSGSPTAYFYQWNANASPIGGATSNVFTVTLTQVGANITCNVIAQNVAGNSTPATSNSLGPVVNGTTANYLIVAGGGGGGSGTGGGGGAGGYQTGTTLLTPGTTYSITVGSGGPGGYKTNYQGVNGGNSSIAGITASIGGGGGGTESPSASLKNGLSGGSGGGAGFQDASTASGGGNVSGQGYSGGSSSNNGSTYACGGGGGAGGIGGANSGTTAGNGGVGLQSSISGVATYYAGGGGGSTRGGSGGSGGAGGGGQGTTSAGTPPTAGTANTGGGGGGEADESNNGGNGGSGIVIISYPGAQQFGGGVISTDGSNTIHTFYTSGSLVPLTSLSASYLLVAGGGGGGSDGANDGLGGGGGAGGFFAGSNVTIDSSSTYVITVGSGGSGAINAPTNGANSSFSAVTTITVGGGAGGYGSVRNGSSGGSGGGGAHGGATGGSATGGQGNVGGNGASSKSGGGGGAGAAGANAVASTSSGNGGVGLSSSISGVSTYYAGGGGGAGSNAGSGGNGGGGAGGSTTGTSGTANTGGGGGGGVTGGGGAGGSGVVIITYPGSTPQMAGGNVTVVSNTVVHTFTSSGYLTPFVNVNNSLRFRASNNAFLYRTPPISSSTLTKLTYSAWVKRSKFGSYGVLYAGYIPTGPTNDCVRFTSSDTLDFNIVGGSVGYIGTTQVFRDPAAWYHICAVVDTTQASSANRMKLWINGVQVNQAPSPSPSQNYNLTGWNNVGRIQTLGADTDQSSFLFDGYMAEVYSIDGQALTPNAFGSFNQYGVWQPVAYAGSYGTNGFYLPMAATSSNYSYLFNQTPSYLSTTSANTIPTGNSVWSAECWTWWNQAPTANWSFIVNQNTAGLQLLYQYSTSKFDIGAYGSADILVSSVVSPSSLINRWNHICYTSDGSNLRIFLNGTLIGYTSSTYSFASQTTVYIGSNAGGSTDTVNGYISNLRVCKGSIPTDYQTSSTTLKDAIFTPSTAPFTTTSQGAANVSLLTCQSSTIVDNSPTPKTLTTVGTVVARNFAQDVSPFNDASPANNSMTSNAIYLPYGSNYDSMKDVPTLTSANVANYATLNPLSSIGATFTNGNLTFALSSSTYPNMYSTIGMTSGKYYCEVSIGNSNDMVGISLLYPINSTNAFYNLANGYGYWGGDGNKYNNASGAAYGASYTSGDIIGIAFDATAGSLTFYKNGTSQGVAYSSIPAGTYFFCQGIGNTSVAGSFNFCQQPFAYTPPAGYLPLNTYNM